MAKHLVWDADDFGCNHVISDMCQSHDCRDVLLQFRQANPKFKATLFAIPGEMTPELLGWTQLNSEWVEICSHGFFHQSNYECEKLSYDDFDFFMSEFKDVTKHFTKGFKAPGWQISDDIYKWLLDNGYWVADQPVNKDRRPKGLKVYEVGENSSHHHTWNCVGNGVYEQFELIMDRIAGIKDFKFVSEVVK